MKLTVSVAQLALRDGEPDHNFDLAIEAAREAARRQSDMLILPELWLQGYSLDRARELAMSQGDRRWQALGDLAREGRLALAGSVLLREGDRVYNTLLVFDRNGKEVARYAKVHLFGLMDEPDYLEPGDRLIAMPFGDTTVGLAICYDVRFPEQFRSLVEAGARILLLPSQWPHPRLAHWQTLVRARAIENQVFVVAANRCGKAGKVHFCGHSAIVDPWGDALVEAGEAPILLTAEVDTARCDEIRKYMPVWTDRRPELYRPDR